VRCCAGGGGVNKCACACVRVCVCVYRQVDLEEFWQNVTYEELTSSWSIRCGARARTRAAVRPPPPHAHLSCPPGWTVRESPTLPHGGAVCTRIALHLQKT
jgi:hypothetical protein